MLVIKNEVARTSRPSLKYLLSRLWAHISLRRRVQFYFLLTFTLLASLAEIVSIGMVVPFLGALINPEKVFFQASLNPLFNSLGISSFEKIPLILTMLFIAATLLAGAIRLTLSWCSIRLAYATGADLSYSIYERTLHQPYSVHIARNSSEVITAIVTKVNAVISNVITPIVTLISSTFLILTITGLLLFINASATLFSVIGFGVIYLIIIRITRGLKQRNGAQISLMSSRVVKALQEGLGGIRDILLDGSQATYCGIYRNADASLRRAQGSNQFIAVAPRFAIESIGMSLIAIAALLLMATQDGGGESSIPVLAALALGAQRLLPVMQQAYAAWSSLVGYVSVLNEAVGFLEQPVNTDTWQERKSNLSFNQEIRFCSVSFSYSANQSAILENVDIVIRKGSRIGIVGKTGSGKSTFVDLLMGLLSPTAGHIEIDGTSIEEIDRRSWQRHIAHVPQVVFLTDTSVAENIAFGIPKENIDMNRVKQAASQAQIANDIDDWTFKYDTIVGERGIRLSGGQRQRIGIARALYKKANVIIFDEATSALDSKTEGAVISALENLSNELTLIIVAHRTSTLKNCTQIIEINKGSAPRAVTFGELYR
jgi:ABC-type multidrug transport system fused ATPase/permease subunit